MLVSLGFGQSTLAADLADDAEDEDDDDEGMPALAGLEYSEEISAVGSHTSCTFVLIPTQLTCCSTL